MLLTTDKRSSSIKTVLALCNHSTRTAECQQRDSSHCKFNCNKTPIIERCSTTRRNDTDFSDQPVSCELDPVRDRHISGCLTLEASAKMNHSQFDRQWPCRCLQIPRPLSGRVLAQTLFMSFFIAYSSEPESHIEPSI